MNRTEYSLLPAGTSDNSVLINSLVHCINTILVSRVLDLMSTITLAGLSTCIYVVDGGLDGFIKYSSS
jgi:uncharacterized sodium:solute symporter family permease YidK